MSVGIGLSGVAWGVLAASGTGSAGPAIDGAADGGGSKDAMGGGGGGEIGDRVTDAGGEMVRSIGELVEQVPWSTQGVMVGLFVGGLVLAVFGRRWMRLGFALLGLLMGAQAGLFLPAAFGFEPASWIGAAIGGAVGLIVGVLAYRATLIGVLGLAGGLIGPAVAMVVLLAGPGLGGGAPDGAVDDGTVAAESGDAGRLRADPFGLGLMPKGAAGGAAGDAARGAAGEAAESEAERRGVEDPSAWGDAVERGAADVGRVLGEVAEKIEPYWSALTTRERAVVVFSGFVGVLLGVAIGLLMETFAGMLVTAYGGAAISLWSGAWLAAALDAGVAGALPTSGWTWLGIWLVVGSLCLALRLGRKKKPSGEGDGD